MKTTGWPARKIEVGLVCAFSSLLLFAATGIAGTEDGLETLKHAETVLGSVPFSAKCVYENGKTTFQSTVIQRKTGRGQIEMWKEMSVGLKGITMTNVYILNESGLWQILHNKVLRLDYLPIQKRPTFGLLENGLDLSVDAEYSAKNVEKGWSRNYCCFPKTSITCKFLYSKRATNNGERYICRTR